MLKYFILVLCLASTTFVRADGPERPTGELVQQLGDASFRQRELAQRELIRRGSAAIADVKRGTSDADLEIRRRCRSILGEIDRSEIDIFLEPFLAGKEDPKTPLPGWDALKKIAGDDETSRSLYALLYRSERTLLETLESKPKSLGEQFDGRVQKLFPQMRGGLRVKQGPLQPATIEDIAAVLLIATAGHADLEKHASNRLFSVVGQPAIQQTVRWSSGTRRLLGCWLELRCDDPTYGQQAVNLARMYGCNELIETKLRPATLKLIDTVAAEPASTAQYYRALNQARQLNMMDVFDQKVRPAIRKGMEVAAREPVNFNRLNQLANCASNLGDMDEELKPIVRPVLLELIKKQAKQPTDMSQFYTITNLARVSQNQDLIEDHLRPAFRASLLRLTAQSKEIAPLTNAFYQAQNLGMQDEIDTILRPAVEVLVQSLAAKKDDPLRLQQVLSAAQTFQLKESLRPGAKELVDEVLRSNADIHRINMAIQLARQAELPDIDQIVEKQLKPAARKALIAAKDQPINAGTIWQTLNLAEQLQLKDGVELAIKAAQTKGLPAYAQSQAIFYIGKHGTRENIPLLEPLLAEKADVGSGSVNGMNIRAQLGDVALAVMISLSGQKLDDYDFPWPAAVGVGGNQILQNAAICYGFENETARQAARKKWRDSQPVQKN